MYPRKGTCVIIGLRLNSELYMLKKATICRRFKKCAHFACMVVFCGIVAFGWFMAGLIIYLVLRFSDQLTIILDNFVYAYAVR